MKKFEVNIMFGLKGSGVTRDVTRLMVAKDHETCTDKILRSLNLRLGRDRVYTVSTNELRR